MLCQVHTSEVQHSDICVLVVNRLGHAYRSVEVISAIRWL